MISTIVSYIKSLRLIPHLLVFRFSKAHNLLTYELDAWLKTHHINKRGWRGFLLLLNTMPEYRSLFYLRTGQHWLRYLARGQTNLYFYMPSSAIGRGLVIWHGFSTVINAKSIGEDCQIWQNVVIGKKTSTEIDDRPVLGDRVKVCASAVVIGDVTIGNDVIVGAGTVVPKDIQNGMTVVAQPFRVV